MNLMNRIFKFRNKVVLVESLNQDMEYYCRIIGEDKYLWVRDTNELKDIPELEKKIIIQECGLDGFIP